MDGEGGFVGRSHELALLRKHLDQVRRGGTDERGRAVLLRGRRRVGKSRLVEVFCEQSGVPWAFFTATRGADPAAERRGLFRNVIEESCLPGREALAGVESATWESALRQLASALPGDQPSVMVLDELPYLVAGDQSVEGALQTAWDRYLSRKPVMLILVGSDLSMMEALSTYGRPFHQRAAEMVL
jgi:AAA+ ATPase superfamily predicted ATPase